MSTSPLFSRSGVPKSVLEALSARSPVLCIRRNIANAQHKPSQSSALSTIYDRRCNLQPLKQRGASSLFGPLTSSTGPLVVPGCSATSGSECRLSSRWGSQSRNFSTASGDLGAGLTLDQKIEKIADMFSEARDELEYAEESKGTTYYNEDKKAAQKAVEDCLAYFEAAKQQCATDAEQEDLQRRIGLRMHELRAQLDALTADDLAD
ncbi:hypothetical protein HK102_010004 [Quaeritorhiza haematococci]|nr:hypothetical protein HK102_010004 [Quaeritorhiza haematococci]